MLERVHAAKHRANKHEEQVQKAQAEAKEREAKRRRQQQEQQQRKVLKIYTIKSVEEDNSGAHFNVVSWNIYTQLKNSKIQQQQRVITGFNGSTSVSPGYVELQLYIQGMPCKHNFFVLPPDAPDDQLILGKPWQRAYKAYIHWAENQVYVFQDKHDDEVMAPHVDQRPNEQGSAVITGKDSNTLQQPKGEKKFKSTKEKLVWRPKKQPETETSTNTEFWLPNNSQKGTTRQIWIPKGTKRQQNNQIWIPKHLLKEKRPEEMKKITYIVYKWVPKKQQAVKKPTIKHVYKWIPKEKQVPVHSTRKDKWKSNQQQVPHNKVVYKWVLKVNSQANT